MNRQKVNIFWFRRDLRLHDNHALHQALKGDFPVLSLFIFDTEITTELDKDDPRVSFIYDTLKDISQKLKAHGSSLLCKQGKPVEIFKELLQDYDIQSVYTNDDYEPYAIQRDKEVGELLQKEGISLHLFKDQVIFAKDDVLKSDQTPYTVFTPYKRKWLEHFSQIEIPQYPVDQWDQYIKHNFDWVKLSDLGFKTSGIKVQEYTFDHLDKYKQTRDFPAKDMTSYLSPHLRFGTVSIREIVKQVISFPDFLSELIWREFFMQILYHFPKVVKHNFKPKYDHIPWRNDKAEFEKWKQGNTGYPMVDAGMRQLNTTGYMHNRVRMVVASFLCKHLLIDWRWGEAYFAEKLLDYELSSNNGNWQWAAGTGCDAAPYFRVFNPTTQIKKFDPQFTYIKKWIPEIEELTYPTPMVEHKFARKRAIETYKKALENN